MKRVLWVFAVIALLAGVLVFTPLGMIATMIATNMVEITEFKVEGDTLFMNGEINSKTLGQFEEVYAENPGIVRLVEQVVPGSNDDDTMIALAYRVRELGISTHLTSDSEIFSGGVDLFLAGASRTMVSGAVIGVHSWSDGIKDAKDYPKDSPEHEQNRKYIEDMLGSDAFYWFTIYAAPADDILNMTNEQIVEFGLLTEPIRQNDEE
ncbi:MAG: alpha/beta hydrolase [Paracoccaceae bacterium]